jgi:hypothetical protein
MNYLLPYFSDFVRGPETGFGEITPGKSASLKLSRQRLAARLPVTGLCKNAIRTEAKPAINSPSTLSCFDL